MRFTPNEKDKLKIEKEKRENNFFIGMKIFSEKNRNKFSIGDILVCFELKCDDDNDQPKITPIKYENSILQERYLVIDVDDQTGISFLYKFNINGKLDKNDVLITISEPYWDEFTFYELDPLFADTVIMGEEYDLSTVFEQEKARLKEISLKRKREAKVFTELAPLNDFLLSLPKNCNLYFHDNSSSNYKKDSFEETNRFRVSVVRSLSVYKKSFKNKQKIYRAKTLFKLNDNKIVYIHGISPGFNSIDLLGKAIYLNEPQSVVEQW
jgi:Mg2+ and Co2+ transporter CorA